MKLDKRIILVGKAASGKDYFKDFLIERGFIPSVSHTTRPMRDGEIDGETYHFVSEEDFLLGVQDDEFYEHKFFNQHAYGTTNDMWNTAEVFIFTPSGIASLPKDEVDKSTIVYFDIPLDVRINRLEERSDADSISRRLDSDNADFKNFNEYNVRVVNPEFDCEKLLKVVLMSMAVC